MKTGIEIITAERARQAAPKAEGGESWSAKHDATHVCGELACAASCYAMAAHAKIYAAKNGRIVDMAKIMPPPQWPWAPEWWKMSNDPIRMLAKAGALIAAEIDRLQDAERCPYHATIGDTVTNFRCLLPAGHEGDHQYEAAK